MRFAALRARTARFSRSCLAAGSDPGGFPRASTNYVCGAAAIPPCAANCRQPDAVRESRSCHNVSPCDRIPPLAAYASQTGTFGCAMMEKADVGGYGETVGIARPSSDQDPTDYRPNDDAM
jgi:hypothetical protein